MYIGFETDNKEFIQKLKQVASEYDALEEMDEFEARPIGMWVPEDVRIELDIWKDDMLVKKAVEHVGTDKFIMMVYKKLDKVFDGEQGMNWFDIEYQIREVARKINKEK